MARRGGGGVAGGGGMMAPVLSIATGLLIFVILIIFAPTIAGSIEKAQPANIGTCSYTNYSSTLYGDCGTANTTAPYEEYTTMVSGGAYWNPEVNENLPNGTETWTTNIQILGVVVLIISIAIAMYYLKGMA